MKIKSKTPIVAGWVVPGLLRPVTARYRLLRLVTGLFRLLLRVVPTFSNVVLSFFILRKISKNLKNLKKRSKSAIKKPPGELKHPDISLIYSD